MFSHVFPRNDVKMEKNQLSFDGSNYIVYDTVNHEKYTYKSHAFAVYMKEVFDRIDKEEAEQRYQQNILELADLDKADFEFF